MCCEISSHPNRFSEELLCKHHDVAIAVRQSAHELHAAVNQFYSKSLPYSVHLDMVAENVLRFADPVMRTFNDVLPVYFGAYYHDSIEDARLTYNDVMRMAKRFMSADQAFIAAEIVYALTNEKGRTRRERADERYYAGIRSTPYAPLVKLADRLANMTFSSSGTDASNNRMLRIYSEELPHFLSEISASDDAPVELRLPAAMVEAVKLLASSRQ